MCEKAIYVLYWCPKLGSGNFNLTFHLSFGNQHLTDSTLSLNWHLRLTIAMDGTQSRNELVFPSYGIIPLLYVDDFITSLFSCKSSRYYFTYIPLRQKHFLPSLSTSSRHSESFYFMYIPRQWYFHKNIPLLLPN